MIAWLGRYSSRPSRYYRRMAKPTNPAVLLAWGDDLLLIEEAVDALALQLAAGGMGAIRSSGRGGADTATSTDDGYR